MCARVSRVACSSLGEEYQCSLVLVYPGLGSGSMQVGGSLPCRPSSLEFLTVDLNWLHCQLVV